MSQRSVLEIAALASAAMPGLSVATTRGSEQFFTSGDKKDIVTAVITSVEGVEYDVSVSSSAQGKKLLKERAKAAYVLSHSKGTVGLSFAVEDYTLFVPGDDMSGVTGDCAVYITPHHDGNALMLNSLTSDQCVSAGTAIAAIHRMRKGFLSAAHYRSYTSADIHEQLTRWIHSLESAGHIPTEIIENWRAIIGTDGLWDFAACPVHGGYSDGDFIFNSSSVAALHHWENMQINDPARDLAWIFIHLDKPRRNAFISAYSRVMGSHLDNMIWLRAGLWTQMEQVGEYMRALANADTAKILAFKSQVNSLAHQIAQSNPQSQQAHKKSTLTVGDLLENPGTVKGKEETRTRGTHSRNAAHTRFVVDSGMRTSSDIPAPASHTSSGAHPSVDIPTRPEMSDDSTYDATVVASTSPTSPRHHWNSAPSQSQSFTLSSSSSLEDDATIAMQAQSAAAAQHHASDETPYTAQSSYVRVDSNGFVLDSSETAGGSVIEPRNESHSSEIESDDTGEAAIAQDDIATTVFATQEKLDESK
ncbi:phosphotransferase [Alloscardovia venturai]|uniref:Phosphotransferase n=1 Tax=Alloscardovia venturai TaxID=1769421 RepID=A0ABW2Y4R8_9BIFI